MKKLIANTGLRWRASPEIRAALVRLLPKCHKSMYIVPAATKDLPELHALYRQFFGKQAPSLAKMSELRSVNSDIFQLIVEFDEIKMIAKLWPHSRPYRSDMKSYLR